QSDKCEEDPVAGRELHPRERVGRKGADGDGDHCRRDGDHEAVEEGLAEVALIEHVRVVLQGELEWRQRRPPPARLGQGERPERADQQADGGQHPRHRQAYDDDVEHVTLEQLRDPARREAGGDRGRLSGGCDRHRRASTARNCLKLKISTGITAISRITATALACPLLPAVYSCSYMRKASTSVL